MRAVTFVRSVAQKKIGTCAINACCSSPIWGDIGREEQDKFGEVQKLRDRTLERMPDVVRLFALLSLRSVINCAKFFLTPTA